MKTIKTANGSIMRVTDAEAKKIVDNYDYYYCSKQEWKNAGEYISPKDKYDAYIKNLKG